MSKLVSIITPSYNSEKYITETIRSVQGQSYSNFEMIIIDDCSSDKTVDLIRSLQQKDSRITLFILEKNSGPAVARNTGISRARGRYLTFLDADDIWDANFIEKSIDAIETTGIPFVFSSYRRYDEKLNPLLTDFIVPEKVTYHDILKTNSISCLTSFLDIERLGKKYMPIIQKRQDMGLWLQYLKEIDYALGIKEPLATYRIRKSSLSRNKTGLFRYQWSFYTEVEHLNFFSSIYYMIHWMIRGLMKYSR